MPQYFGRLGLTYGKALRFKQEFAKTFPAHSSVKSRERSSPTNVKPTMGDMSFFSPEKKRMYLVKRRKVGLLASEHWKNVTTPKFSTPQMKAELANFAAKISSECAMPEVGFNEEGIMRQVKTFFNEQRRYNLRKKSDSKVTCLTEQADPKLPELQNTSGDDLDKQKSECDDQEPRKKRHKIDRDQKRNQIEGMDSDGMLNGSANFNTDLQNSSARSGTPS